MLGSYPACPSRSKTSFYLLWISFWVKGVGNPNAFITVTQAPYVQIWCAPQTGGRTVCPFVSCPRSSRCLRRPRAILPRIAGATAAARVRRLDVLGPPCHTQAPRQSPQSTPALLTAAQYLLDALWLCACMSLACCGCEVPAVRALGHRGSGMLCACARACMRACVRCRLYCALWSRPRIDSPRHWTGWDGPLPES
jgi:hypothetical protein